MGELLFNCRFNVDSHVSKKNQKRVAGNRIVQSQGSKRLLDFMILKFAIAKQQFRADMPIDEPVRLKAIFGYPDLKSGKKKARTKRVMDLSNLIQGVEDCLEKAEVLKNDKLIESYDGSRRIYGESDQFFVSVYLYRAKI